VISSGEQIWGADYPYSTDNDELEDDLELAYDEEIEILSEAEQATPYDFILSEATAQQDLEPPQQLQVTTTTPATSEEIIHTIARVNPVVEESSSLKNATLAPKPKICNNVHESIYLKKQKELLKMI